MIRTYKSTIKIRLGIDDLICIDAFVGASQGDRSRTNSVAEYIANKGWLLPVFNDINYMNQDEVDKEIEKRSLANEYYIQELKDSNKYGIEVDKIVEFHLMDHPGFDNRDNCIIENYEYKIINFGKEK